MHEIEGCGNNKKVRDDPAPLRVFKIFKEAIKELLNNKKVRDEDTLYYKKRHGI